MPSLRRNRVAGCMFELSSFGLDQGAEEEGYDAGAGAGTMGHAAAGSPERKVSTWDGP